MCIPKKNPPTQTNKEGQFSIAFTVFIPFGKKNIHFLNSSFVKAVQFKLGLVFKTPTKKKSEDLYTLVHIKINNTSS